MSIEIEKLGISLPLSLFIVAAIAAVFVAIFYFGGSMVFAYEEYETPSDLPPRERKELISTTIYTGLNCFYQYALICSLLSKVWVAVLVLFGLLIAYNLLFIIWLKIVYAVSNQRMLRHIRQIERRNKKRDVNMTAEELMQLQADYQFSKKFVNGTAMFIFSIFAWVATVVIQLIMIF